MPHSGHCMGGEMSGEHRVVFGGIAIALAGIDFFLFGPQSPLQGWQPF